MPCLARRATLSMGGRHMVIERARAHTSEDERSGYRSQARASFFLPSPYNTEFLFVPNPCSVSVSLLYSRLHLSALCNHLPLTQALALSGRRSPVPAQGLMVPN